MFGDVESIMPREKNKKRRKKKGKFRKNSAGCLRLSSEDLNFLIDETKYSEDEIQEWFW